MDVKIGKAQGSLDCRYHEILVDGVRHGTVLAVIDTAPSGRTVIVGYSVEFSSTPQEGWNWRRDQIVEEFHVAREDSDRLKGLRDRIAARIAERIEAIKANARGAKSWAAERVLTQEVTMGPRSGTAQAYVVGRMMEDLGVTEDQARNAVKASIESGRVRADRHGRLFAV